MLGLSSTSDKSIVECVPVVNLFTVLLLEPQSQFLLKSRTQSLASCKISVAYCRLDACWNGSCSSSGWIHTVRLYPVSIRAIVCNVDLSIL